MKNKMHPQGINSPWVMNISCNTKFSALEHIHTICTKGNKLWCDVTFAQATFIQ
jgi:hypothetical protein